MYRARLCPSKTPVDPCSAIIGPLCRDRAAGGASAGFLATKFGTLVATWTPRQ